MNILIIDSSKKQAYVDVIKNDEIYANVLNEKEKHSESLLPTIDKTLSLAQVNLSDVDFFGVVTGPGSFTGLRVALSTIKAFQFVHNKKVVAVNSFEPFFKFANSGIILLNSTSNSFYYCIFKKKIIEKMGVVNFLDLDKIIQNKNIYMLDTEKYIELKDYNINFVDNYNEALIECVKNKIKANEFVSDQELEPNYLQLSQAEQQLKNKG